MIIGGETIQRRCRFCNTALEDTLVDLGVSPLANSFRSAEELGFMEPFYPLHVYVCSNCYLVQLEELANPQDIFSDYAYFSSYSSSWLEHASSFAQMTINRFDLDERSRVIEIGSNDGYLLRFYKEAGIPVLGIEPAANVAQAAKEIGVETLIRFFGPELAEELVQEGKRANLLVGNNVLAHIPALNDLIRSMKMVLKRGGVVTMEFPHLLALMEGNQFDTIYHEHYSYFSLTSAVKIFDAHGLRISDVDRVPTHGGSLRIYVCHAEEPCWGSLAESERVGDLLAEEEARGLLDLHTYRAFGSRVQRLKREILKFLIEAYESGCSVAAYGAPAKGNTLLNYCGIGPDLVSYTVDRNPNKQGRYLPGSRIPIYTPEFVFEDRPDYLVILPWNLKGEIMAQMAPIREWGGRFVTFIPGIEVY